MTRRRSLDVSAASENYEKVMDASERYAVAHRNYLTFTLDLVALGSQLRSLGGGKEAITSLARIEAANLADALQAARVKVRHWLNPREVAALSRIAVDPESAANVQNRPTEQAGVDPSAIGPMYLEEPRNRNGIVY